MRAVAARSDGPELRTIRRRVLGDERFRPAPERVAGADVQHDELVAGVDTRRRQPRRHPFVRVGDERHFHRVVLRVAAAARPAGDRLQQVPLVGDRVPRPQLRRAVRHARVHPPPPRDVVADPFPRAAGPRQPGRARAAVQVEREIETRPPQPPRQRDVRDDPFHPARPRHHDHLVEMRIVPDDRRRIRLDQVGEPRLRVRPAQPAQQRRREHDVADEAQPDEQDVQGSIVASSISITGMSSLIG
jgi:hypothetical protein